MIRITRFITALLLVAFTATPLAMANRSANASASVVIIANA